MKKDINTKGIHYILDLWNCNQKILNQPNALLNILTTCSEKLETQVVGKCFHQFQPQGVTGILLLAESHISIHTFPEYSYASVDFYLCSTHRDATEAVTWIIDQLSSEKWHIKTLVRGVL